MVSNLTNISNNLQAGLGRIEDADFAAETTNLARTQILQQASTAMLAQANAAKQNVLRSTSRLIIARKVNKKPACGLLSWRIPKIADIFIDYLLVVIS